MHEANLRKNLRQDNGLLKKRTRLLALEPRMLFDGALAADVAAAATHADAPQKPVDTPPPSADKSTAGLLAERVPAAPQTIVFIDENVANYQQLAQGVSAGATVVLIASNQDGIQVITDTLAAAQNVASVQIISHGTPGELVLGNRTVDSTALLGQLNREINSWQEALAPQADILLLGCDVAQGASGQLFVNTLSQITGAAVGASTNLTGGSGAGGDWNLEYSTGMLNTPLAIAPSVLAAYDQDLAAVPDVTITAPTNVLIGTNFTFELDFSNTGSMTGYGPYVDLYLPTNGKDGVNGVGTDGVTFVSASYLGTALTATVLTFDASGNATHPYAVNSAGNPIIVNASTFGGQAGDELVVLQLPFGSYTPGQPVAPITVTASLSNLADVGAGKQLNIEARAGFQYGLTPVVDPATDPSIVGGIDANGSQNINPQVYTLTTAYNGPEGETATGPDYARSFTVTVNVAPGQTLTNFDVTELLPNSLVYQGATGTTGALDPASLLLSTSAPSNAENVVWDFGNVTGTQSFTTNFYVPRLDANNNPVLNAATGAPVTISMSDSATGNWTPLDPRDSAQVINVTTPNAASLTAKSIATQNSVTDISDLGAPGFTPGDTVRYTMDTQVSDYFATGNMVLTDTLGDGVTYQGGSGVVTFYRGSTVVGAANFTDGGNLAITNNADGTTTLAFNVSSALGGTGRFVGANVAGAPGSDPYRAVVTFNAQVLDQYKAAPSYSGTPANNMVKEGDAISNSEIVTADILDASSAYATLYAGQTDNSAAGISIPQGSLQISVYAVDGSTSFSSLNIAPLDTITYRLTYTFADSNFEGLTLNSFLPLPIFNTTDPNQTGTVPATLVWTQDTSGTSSTAPAVGEFKLGPSDTLNALGVTLTPTVTGISSTNSVAFSFGRSQTVSNGVQVIDVLYTVKASGAQYADGLQLTNLGQENDVNSPGVVANKLSLTKIQRAEPVVTIQQGIVAVNDPNASLTAAAGGGVTWAAAGSSGLPFTGTIDTTSLTANPINANVTGIEAGDTVRYATSILNKGSSPNGAFDLTLTDGLPADFAPAANMQFNAVNGAGQRLAVTDASGTLIMDATGAYVGGATQATLVTALTTSGIRLQDPADVAGAGGALKASDPTNGLNIALITFDLVAQSSIQPKEVTTSTATLVNYSGFNNGSSYATGAGLTDTATTTTLGANVVKTLIATDQAFTTGNNVAIGEVLTYQAVITVPEGTSSKAGGVTFSDTLSPGLAFVGVTSIMPSSGVSTDVGGGFAAVQTPASIGANGSNFTLNFGTVTNSNLNAATTDTITVVYKAVVLDVASNKNGVTDNNHATWATTLDSKTGSAAVVVREANLGVTVTPGAANVQAGDVVTYTVRVQNNGTTDAFDVNLNDLLPAGVQNLALVSAVADAGVGTVDNSATSATQLVSTITDIPVGKGVTYTITGTVASGVAFGQVITDTATATATSLPGTYTPPTAYAANTERSGTDGTVAANPNTYTASGSSPVTVFIAQPQLTEVTSEAATVDTPNGSYGGLSTSGQVAIGEIVRYQLVVSIPQSVTNNLQLTESLPAGVQFLNDGTAQLAFVSSTGANVTSSGAPAAINSFAAALTGDQTSVNGLTPTYVIPGADISSAGNTVTFSLGNVSNANNNPNIEYVVVDFNAIVTNVAGNTAGKSLAANFTVSRDISGAQTTVATSNTATETVVEPAIANFAQQVIATDGTNVTYQITFSNSGTATAFDAHVLDSLPGNLSNLANVNVTLGGGASGITNNSNASQLDTTIGQIPVGGTVTITYTAQVNNAALAASDTANLTYTSLIGSGTPLAGSTQGAVGSTTGERTGSGVAPNAYDASVTTGIGVIGGTVWNDIEANLAAVNATGAPLGGQPLLQNVPIQLAWAGPDGVFGTADDVTLNAVTNAAGQYSFGALPAGNYRVQLGSGWTGFVANGGSYSSVFDVSAPVTDNLATVALGSAATQTAVNFGERSANTAPAFANLTSSAQYAVGGSAAVIDGALSVSDANLTALGDNFGGSVLTVVRQGGASANDVFSNSGLLGALTQGGNLVYNGSTVGSVTTNSGGTLQLTFADGVNRSTVNAVIEAVTYQNNSGTPPTAVTLAYTFNDGNPANPNGRQGTGGALSASGTLTLTRADIAPTIASLPGAPDSFTEGGTPVVLAPAGVLNDADLQGANNWNGATLTVARHGGANADDVFGGTGAVSLSGGNIVVGGVTVGSYTQNAGQLALTFNANATTARVDQLMQGITYSNSNANPPASVTLDYTVNDGNNAGAQGTGGALAGTGSVVVNIVAIDSPPVNTVPGAVADLQNQLLSFTGANTISIADPDASGGGMTATLGVLHGTLSVVAAGGAGVTGSGTANVVITGTVAQINATLAGLGYTPNTNYYGADTLTLATNDNGNTGQMPGSLPGGSTFGNGGTSIVTTSPVTLNIGEVNSAPSFTALGPGQLLTAGQAAVQLSPNGLVHDLEMDAFSGGAGSYSGSTLTLSRQGGANASDVFGVTGANVSFAGGNANVGGIAIGSVTQVGGLLTFVFNANATTARVDQLLEAINYRNSSAAPPSSLTIVYQLNDGNSGLQGFGGALSGTASVTLNFASQFVPPPAPLPPGLPPVDGPQAGPGNNPSPPGSGGPTGFILAGGVGGNEGGLVTFTDGSRLPPFGDSGLNLNMFSIVTANGVKTVGPDGQVLESTTFGWPAERQPVPGATRELRLGTPIGTQNFRLGAEFVFELPHNSFMHTDPDNVVNLIATRPDGQPLPGWISFDDISGIFSGTPPPGATSVDVLVVARDQEGHEAQQTFRINFAAATGAMLRPAESVRLADGHSLRSNAGHAEVAAIDAHGATGARPAVRSAALRFGDQLKAAKPRHAAAFENFPDSHDTPRNAVQPAAS